MVTIATFEEPAQANHLKERLQQEGVKADVHNEAALQSVLGKPHANAKVLVQETDFEAAQKWMIEWEASDPQIGAPLRCPQCGSTEIEYPQFSRKFFMPWMAGVLFALRLFPKEFYCRQCQNTWPPGEPKS